MFDRLVIYLYGLFQSFQRHCEMILMCCCSGGNEDIFPLFHTTSDYHLWMWSRWSDPTFSDVGAQTGPGTVSWVCFRVGRQCASSQCHTIQKQAENSLISLRYDKLGCSVSGFIMRVEGIMRLDAGLVLQLSKVKHWRSLFITLIIIFKISRGWNAIKDLKL